MKKPLLLITGFILLFSFVGSSWAQEVHRYPIMQPDRETREKWRQELESAPKAFIDPLIAETLDFGPKPMLLDHITYTPSERNQGYCGNCWVWAGTAQMEILHSTEHGARDRLSIQYFDSCWTDINGNYAACNGGSLNTFLTFYNQHTRIPWSNPYAQFQDAGGTTTQTCGGISGIPYYSALTNSFTVATVTTIRVGQATAIANIKNVLAQNKGVEFNFCLANYNDWYGTGGFQDFFDNSAETVSWNPDNYCGHTWDDTWGGCHAVVIVGYNDDDAANPYWIVLNSWGAPSGHPNGFFRMKMNMNYGCTLNDPGPAYSLGFQTINTQNDPFYDDNSLYMAAKGEATNNIFIRKKNSGESWGAWTQVSGSTSHAPSMANFNSRLYMAVKGVVTPKIWVRSMNYSGAWDPSGWTEIPGGSTSASPILVTYRNRLYAFAKGNATGNIYYNSMNTNGVWSGWLQISGAATIDAPAVVVYNDQIVLFQTDSTGHIYMNLMSSDGTWSGWYGWIGGGYEMQTNVGPAATVFNNSVLLVVKGLYGTPWANTISYMSSAGSVHSWYGWQQTPGGLTTQRPQVAWGPTLNQFHVSVKGFATGIMWENHYDSTANTWAGWTQSAGFSTQAPSANTYYLGNMH